MSLSAGNAQTATVGTAVATAPSVLVTDAYNNPVSGIAVTFAVASGGGSVTGARRRPPTRRRRHGRQLDTGHGRRRQLADGDQDRPDRLAGDLHRDRRRRRRHQVRGHLEQLQPRSPATAVTITAQLADQYNNPVATAGISVTFTKTGTGGLWALPTRRPPAPAAWPGSPSPPRLPSASPTPLRPRARLRQRVSAPRRRSRLASSRSAPPSACGSGLSSA